jgi:general transcription factor 3C polypeptide 5 (transcription factor C subunit 1)
MSESRCPGMVDYQYQIDLNDPVAKLRLAMDNMDGMSLLFILVLSQLNSAHLRAVEAIQQYSIPEEKEDYTLPANPVLDPQLVADSKEPQSISSTRSNLRLFPPPLFSRQGISQNYKCALSCYLLYSRVNGNARPQFQSEPFVHDIYYNRRRNR